MSAGATAPSAKQLRLLFVDDEPMMLRLLKTLMRKARPSWAVEVAESGAAALAIMAEKGFDVVVSDLRMPEMTGARFLQEVHHRYPQTVRIILTSHAEEAMVPQCLAVSHQQFTKPFNVAGFTAALDDIGRLREGLPNPEVQGVLAELNHLPSPPPLYLRMLKELQEPNSFLEDISDLVVADPALAAKLLQVSNSAFLGFSRPVTSVTEAIQLLGLSGVRLLLLTCKLFSSFDPIQFRELSIDRLWNHSLQTAGLAKRIVHAEQGSHALMEEAFTLGLLHDIGKLIQATHWPALYRETLEQVQATGHPFHQVERTVFKVAHAKLGAYLVGIWGLPASVVQGVAWHHSPEAAPDPHSSSLTAVHVANLLAQGVTRIGPKENAEQPVAEYLARLGLADRLPVWQGLRTATAEDLVWSE